ncbi:MAG: ATP phosphoribosyltransferase regulatory subunit [Candidatus Poribacteria bacterium]|nr:ATP phosphoribosyltransferase regulatory subunit [Candidatus Poribacteria bacterium]
MEKFDKPTGTNDFLPDQMVQRNFVEDIVRETFETYGYAQVQTPLFESFALLSAQSGEEIRHKMFTFVGSDRIDYALRPELTAPVCRLIANGDLKHLPYPYKLYYIGQCVRQEPISDGTEVKREFRQAGVELIGPASAHADAEIITIPIRILERLDISQTKLRIGNTGVFRGIFKQGALDPKDQAEMIWDIDHLVSLRNESELWDMETLRDALNMLRRLQGFDYQGTYKIETAAIQELTESTAPAFAEKLPTIAEETYKARWHRYFNVSEEIAQCCIDVSKICGDKNTVMTAWETRLGDAAQAARQELLALCDCLENYGITDFEINLGITRGFDFYTGAVFQIELPEKRLPLCGGGRYDNLIASFGGPSMPGAGFAFQFDALVEAFTDLNKETPVNGRKDYFIAAETPEGIAEAQRLAETLRKAGKNVEVDLMERDLQAQQDYASQANYDYLVRLVLDEPIRRIEIKTGDTEVVTANDLL